MNYLAVFFGCGAGGIARYALTRCASEHVFSAVPAGTLAVNLIGSFLIGFFFSLFRESLAPPPLRVFVTTGFLGGFTTFSTYALETAVLFEKREFRAGVANLLIHNLAGLAAVACGALAYALVRLAVNGGPRA